MMKPVPYLLCILALSLLATACSAQNPADAGATPSASDELQTPVACYMPLYFDSEEDLLRTLNDVREKKGTQDNAVRVCSDFAGEQTYDAESDMLNLAGITQFYRPGDIPDGMIFDKITVKSEYVSYGYVNGDQIGIATFTWFREMPPEVAMNELYGRGAISEREIEHNGIKYVFLEWLDPALNEPGGFSIHWVDSGIAYQAYMESGHTDDEMLAFCQFEAVAVE